jgi:hypothetical protein
VDLPLVNEQILIDDSGARSLFHFRNIQRVAQNLSIFYSFHTLHASDFVRFLMRNCLQRWRIRVAAAAAAEMRR